jgi:hypothetical protein
MASILFSFYKAKLHTTITKYIKELDIVSPETKNMGMDFIFANTNVLKDGFYCEDEPVQRDFKDKKKTKMLREQALNYWEL